MTNNTRPMVKTNNHELLPLHEYFQKLTTQPHTLKQLWHLAENNNAGLSWDCGCTGTYCECDTPTWEQIQNSPNPQETLTRIYIDDDEQFMNWINNNTNDTAQYHEQE